MTESIALIGSGLIGRGWAILFANVGCEVRFYDADASAVERAQPAIHENLLALEAEQLIESAAALEARIRFCDSIAAALEGARYVQESVAESAEVKGAVFRELGTLTGPDTVLASSCSSIPPEEFMADVRHRERCLIAHPCSPPHLMPLVEVVTTRWTSPAVLQSTYERLLALGQRPVRVHKPVAGFAINRLQAVLIDAAISLVEEGIMDPADVDLCMSQGLGLRWAFMGPFETMDMNSARGFKEYVTKYGSAYHGMLNAMRPTQPWNSGAVDRIEAWRRAQFPGEDDVTRRRLWRDRNLMKLARLFRGARLGGSSA